MYDRLVFNKIREKLGGNIIRMATGSAPIADEVMIFSKAAFSCPIPEGYGQTEATCSVTFCHPFDIRLGELKLILMENLITILHILFLIVDCQRSLRTTCQLLHG